MTSIVRSIFLSDTALMRWLRYLLLFSVLILGVMRLATTIGVLGSDLIYKKDVLQEYLASKAVLDGIDPYTSLDELAARYIGPITYLPHPMPYPPPSILLSLPFGLLDVKSATIAWFLVEVVCIVFVAYMTLKLLRTKASAVNILLTSLILFAWHPFWEDLLYGQLSILVLTLLVFAFYLRQKGENFWAGIVLGLPIAIKLFGWLLLIFFILKKNWKLVIGSGITIAVTNIAAGIIVGFDHVFNYYLNAITEFSDYYHSFAYNYSLWTIGWRFFSGTESNVLQGINAPPLIESPTAAGITSIVLPLLYIIIGLSWALKAKETNTALAILVCVSVLVNPIVWVHYFVILLFPFIILVNLLRSQDLPPLETISLMIITAILFILDNTTLKNTVERFGLGTEIEGNIQVSFLASLITLIPVILVIGYAILLWRIDRKPYL